MPSKLCAYACWIHPINNGEGKIPSCIAFWLLAVYLCVLPIDHTIALRHLVFFPLVLLTLWSAWRYKLRLHLPLATPWLIYSVIALLSTSFAIDPSFSFGEVKKEIGYSMLILMVTATWVRYVVSLERLILILIISNIALISSALFNITITHPFWHYSEMNVFLHYNNPLYEGNTIRIYGGIGDFSTYLITVIPIIAAYSIMLPKSSRALKFGLLLLLVLNAVVLFVTRSRMGMMALTAESIIYMGFLLVRHKKNITPQNIFIAITLTVMTGVLLGKMLQTVPILNDDRIDIWRNGIAHIQSHPLAGHGFGRTILKRVENQSNPLYSSYDHWHNMVINKGVQIGIPGMLVFLLLLGMTLRALWPRHILDHRLWGYALAATVMSLGVFLKSMTDDFFVNNNALLYWTLVGGVLGALAESKKKAQSIKE